MDFWSKIFSWSRSERVYLDFAAATPLLPEAKAAMEPFLTGEFGNPSSIHLEGQFAKRAVEDAREKIARALETRAEWVTFTSGGTEGNNLVILGLVEALRQRGRSLDSMEVVTTGIEHPSIYRTLHHLEQMGVVVRYVAVDKEGLIPPTELSKVLTARTVLFTTAYANNEIGVIQPIHALRKVVRKAEKEWGTDIFIHLDAAQAPLWLPCRMDTLGVDFVVLDAAKCCGPKGTGVVVRSRRALFAPVTYGGGQEGGLRAGTENVAGVVGAGVAIVAAQKNWRERKEKASLVRDQGIASLLQGISGAVLNGPMGENRLANNINISIPGCDTEYLTVWLDSKGFAVSTKSACGGAGGGESAVVMETTADAARATSTLRITFGPTLTTRRLATLAAAITDFRTKTTI